MLHPYSDSRHRDDSFIYFISLKEAVKPFQWDYWVLKIQDIKRHFSQWHWHCTTGKGGDNSTNNGLLVATPPGPFVVILHLVWVPGWGCHWRRLFSLWVGRGDLPRWRLRSGIQAPQWQPPLVLSPVSRCHRILSTVHSAASPIQG